MTHTNYGIRVLKTRRKALAIDQENGNNVWSDAIKKEMRNVAPDFKLKADDKCIRSEYKQACCLFKIDQTLEFDQNLCDVDWYRLS